MGFDYFSAYCKKVLTILYDGLKRSYGTLVSEDIEFIVTSLIYIFHNILSYIMQ
jgi:hypothetical protein